MDLRLLDSDSMYAATDFPAPAAPPAAESTAAAEPTSSGLSEVEADPGMAPYGDAGQSRQPANSIAPREALIPAADLLDSASTGADSPVEAEPKQGPITSPAQLSASPADAPVTGPAQSVSPAEAQQPLAAAGDIQPAAPANDAPVPAAPGTPRALAEAADDAVSYAKAGTEEHGPRDNRNGSPEQRKAAGQLNQIKAAIAAVSAWETASYEALQAAKLAHSSDGVDMYDDPEVKACWAGLAAAKAERDQGLLGTPLGRAVAAERAVDRASYAWQAAKQQQEDEVEAGKYHSHLKLIELRENTHASEQKYRAALDTAVGESKAALDDAIRMAKRAGADVENDPQVSGCRASLEIANVDRDWRLRDDLKRTDYYSERIDQMLKQSTKY